MPLLPTPSLDPAFMRCTLFGGMAELERTEPGAGITHARHVTIITYRTRNYHALACISASRAPAEGMLLCGAAHVTMIRHPDFTIVCYHNRAAAMLFCSAGLLLYTAVIVPVQVKMCLHHDHCIIIIVAVTIIVIAPVQPESCLRNSGPAVLCQYIMIAIIVVICRCSDCSVPWCMPRSACGTTRTRATRSRRSTLTSPSTASSW